MFPTPSADFNPYAPPEAPLTPVPEADDPLKPWLGSLGWRLAAWFVDYLVFGGVFIPTAFLCTRLASRPNVSELLRGLLLSEPMAFLVGATLFVSYFSAMESSALEATVGKWLFGLRVTRLDGQPITFTRAAGRCVLWFLGYCTLGAGPLTALTNRRRQAFHDLIAQTVVLKRRIVVEHSSN